MQVSAVNLLKQMTLIATEIFIGFVYYLPAMIICVITNIHSVLMLHP